MVYIYILLLQKNKYYVGKTTRPKFRLIEHFNSGGSAWTKKYKPVKILQILPNCDDYDEDKYTKIYMDKHGINNVRGGSYSKIQLDKTTVAHLTRMSNGANDKCFDCGKKGHFAKYCPNRKKAKNDSESEEEPCIWNSESDDEWSCSYCNKGFATKKGAQFHENVHCKVRKQKKNYAWSCSYCNKGFATKKGAQFHENFHCKVRKKTKNNRKKDPTKPKILRTF